MMRNHVTLVMKNDLLKVIQNGNPRTERAGSETGRGNKIT